MNIDSSIGVLIAFWVISFLIGFVAKRGSVLLAVWVGLYFFYAALFSVGLIILIVKTINDSKAPTQALAENLSYKILMVGMIIIVPYVLKETARALRHIAEIRKRK